MRRSRSSSPRRARAEYLVGGACALHELGIAESVLQAVRDRAAEEHARAIRVGVRIGPLAGVDRNSLAFCFDAIVKGSEFEPLSLEVEDGAADELALSYLELEDG